MSASMANSRTARAKYRQLRCGLVLLVLGLWTSSGCSYFRFGHRSYDEIDQMNKEKQQEQRQFTPGTGDDGIGQN